MQVLSIIAQLELVLKIAAASGPRVARAFHLALAVIFLLAWASLAVQLAALYGSQGLLPIADSMQAMRASDDFSLLDIPTLFWWFQSDAALWVVLGLGVVAAAVALTGKFARPAFAVTTLMYLSFAVAGRSFLSFQWDNLLIEMGFLATLLPRDRPAPFAHALFRLLLFKLYFESGIAKWQSTIGDWQDGSAMQLYFETAPLPTWVAWYAHHLPALLLKIFSWGTLVLELLVPWLVFGPRRTRLVAFWALTLFQVANMATANYGFFCWLALALHLFLLDEFDLPHVKPRDPAANNATVLTRLRAVLVGVLYVYVSVGEATAHFSAHGAWPGVGVFESFRLINTYHLFGSITRTRIEPEIQVSTNGVDWTPYHLWHKPGDVKRAPDFVAPHQPRLDFQLWFHGLSPRTSPAYVERLLSNICTHTGDVQTFFRDTLPQNPIAVRVAYARYTFATSEERSQTLGDFWVREEVGVRPARVCGGNSP